MSIAAAVVALLLVVQVALTLPLAILMGRRPAPGSRRPALPPHPSCAGYGACGHCGARGGGECVIWAMERRTA